MEFLSSSSFDPLCPQNEETLFQTPNCVHHPAQLLQAEGDQIIPTITPHRDDDDDDNGDLDHLLAQIPHFLEEDHQCHYQLKVNSNNIQHGQRRKASSVVLDDPHGHGSVETKKKKKKQRIIRNESNDVEKKQQRIIHREVERQRRLEMSSLHASLRSLLPLECIKGKRSMSDHFDVATNYINHLQEKIKGLRERRDGLKLEVCNSNYEVIVNPWNSGGVEVTMCTSSSGQGLALSRVLQCLAKQGLDVVSSISNRVSNKLVHSIQAQVGDERSTPIDPIELQQQLANIHIFT